MIALLLTLTYSLQPRLSRVCKSNREIVGRTIALPDYVFRNDVTNTITNKMMRNVDAQNAHFLGPKSFLQPSHPPILGIRRTNSESH